MNNEQLKRLKTDWEEIAKEYMLPISERIKGILAEPDFEGFASIGKVQRINSNFIITLLSPYYLEELLKDIVPYIHSIPEYLEPEWHSIDGRVRSRLLKELERLKVIEDELYCFLDKHKDKEESSSSAKNDKDELTKRALGRLHWKKRQKYHTYENITLSIDTMREALSLMEEYIADISAVFQEKETMLLPGFCQRLTKTQIKALVVPLRHIESVLGTMRGTRKVNEVIKALHEISSLLDYIYSPSGIVDEELITRSNDIKMLLESRLAVVKRQEVERAERVAETTEKIKERKYKNTLIY